MADWIGKTIGKVRIETYLARGGMAEVYLGTHLTLDRHVALKFMHSHIESEPELMTRFQREAKAVAGLRHPNIVQVYDFDTYEGHPYIVMEYVNGPSLAMYLKGLHKNGGRLTLKQVAQLLKPLAEGIDYAHSQGIIHRDIKPANVILTNNSAQYSPDKPFPADTTCVITDFGLARLTGSVTQTASGVVSGTPAYMSPEQAQGNSSVDFRTDIYSLSVVLYEMLAGRPPFDGDSTIGLILKLMSEPPPPIENVPPEIQAVVAKGLEKLPENRYQSARELLTEFYRAVGMHADAETVHSLRFKTPPSTVSSVPKPSPRRSSLPWIGAVIAACLCFGVILTGAIGISIIRSRSGATLVGTVPAEATAPETHSAQTTEEAGANPEAPISGEFPGVLRFQGALDQVTISGAFPDPDEGFQYEAWLADDANEAIISIGIMEKSESGNYTLTYLDSESRNLLNVYNRMEVTLETIPDPSPNPADIIYSSAIPSGALIHIRHLLGSFSGNPNQTAMTVGLLQTSREISDAGEAMSEGDEKIVRSNAEAMINLIVGSQSADFKDWDGNGAVENPGDGFGLLLNGGQTGYIEGTITHAELSASSGDATQNIKLHAEHVAVSGKNIEGWATQLRDVAKRILESAPGRISEADVRLAVSLADQILNGVDLDGDESIGPVEGEGGAITAYEHAEYMADMQILEGANQVPPPGNP
ncbi:MAG: Serine/threonine-protein kinase PknD [Anaerolineales bacterium]|nr:Serine/threonine-protein kinase PknD [Anaerolineales bacterium]